MTGGMISQEPDLLAIVRSAQSRGKPVVVGGPDPTANPECYREADHLVLGEAEAALPEFLADLERGVAKQEYVPSRRADMTASPVPRFDLLKLDRYLHVGIQYTRGCPHKCEFCEIIERYGSVSRLKTDDQMLAELQALYVLGYRGHVSLVADNLAGNKAPLRGFLLSLRKWLAEHDWPFDFSTDVSIDITDNEDLLDLMQEASFSSLFLGLETPDEQTLKRISKFQNLRRDFKKSIYKIYRRGMFVSTTFILGFDYEPDDIRDRILQCIKDTSVPIFVGGLLFALPKTQLYRGLDAEGRLDED